MATANVKVDVDLSALHRAKALVDVSAERDRQEVLWPGSSCASLDMSPGQKLAILTEEVGEVAKEMNDACNEGRAIDAQAMRTELIQVAAVTVAWAESL